MTSTTTIFIVVFLIVVLMVTIFILIKGHKHAATSAPTTLEEALSRTSGTGGTSSSGVIAKDQYFDSNILGGCIAAAGAMHHTEDGIPLESVVMDTAFVLYKEFNKRYQADRSMMLCLFDDD